MMSSGQLLLACLLDLVIGDPRWLPHPVRLMGRAIAWYEHMVRPVVRTAAGQRVAGLVLAIGLPLMAYMAGWVTVTLAGMVHGAVGNGMAVFLAVTTLAARDLADQALAVQRALEAGFLEQAREAVSRIVGRDTTRLAEPEVVRATVEAVAESASDGVIAPLFYLTLGGPPLALAYKAINTLDSVVGHREPKYRHLGWASARFDDGANWIPARVTALLLVLAAGAVCKSARIARHAWRILRRDGRKHPSPNSGQSEAAMAGALRVQLGGRNFYHGVPEDRPLLGDPQEPLVPTHIRQAVVLMMTAFVLAAGLAAALRLL